MAGETGGARLSPPGPAIGTPETERKGTERKGTEKKGIGGARDRSLHAPALIEFPDTIVGDRPTIDVYIVNMNATYEATIDVSVDGAKEFVVRSKPARLRPGREGVTRPIVIEFLPRARTDLRARLRVQATWQMNAVPPEDIVVELRGKSHLDGEPTHAEAAEAARRDKEAAAAAARKEQTRAALEKAFDKYTALDGPQPHRGQELKLQRMLWDAEGVLEDIARAQRDAIDVPKEEAGHFNRRPRVPQRELAWEIGIRVLDLVSAGLAGVVAGAIHRAEHDLPAAGPKNLKPSAASFDFVAESAKSIMKDSAKAVLKQAKENGKDLQIDSKEAAIYFFAMQKSLVREQINQRRAALGQVYFGFVPKLHVDAHRTVAAFKTIVDGLTAAHGKAPDLQEHQARLAWMSFLSQGALGSVPAPAREGGTTTDTRGASATASDRGRVTPIDGVVEVEIEADYNKPASPVTVLSVRCTGIIRNMLSGVVKTNDHRLRGLAVVVRATGRAKGVAEFRVSVVQDEGGNIRYTDNTGAAGTPSTWLTRKAGGWGTTRQHAGARKLMDEVLDAPLTSVEVWTDQA